MRRPKLLHPVTTDMRRELSVATLAKAGGFRQPMRGWAWASRSFQLCGHAATAAFYRIHRRRRPKPFANCAKSNFLKINWRSI
jgi:hypothetical protein